MADYDISETFANIENELIDSMMRNFSHHRAEETKEGYNWSQWQAEELKSFEQYRKQNANKFNKQFTDINSKISEMLKTARADGNAHQEISILQAIRNGFKAPKLGSNKSTAEFFKLNDRKLNALIKATTNDFKRAETAILRMSNDKYRKAIYNAQVYCNSGSGTYEKAIDMACKDMLNAGLNCVEYKNGARHTLENYSRMALRTANKRAYLRGEGEKRAEWGISTVVVNNRQGGCPLCTPYIGRVFIDDVYSNGKSKDSKYPLLSDAVIGGLFHPNCKDSTSTYFEGITTLKPVTNKERSKMIENNDNEQKYKYAIRQQKRFERRAEYSLDEDNKRVCSARADEWQSRAEKIVDVIPNKEKVNFAPAKSIEEAQEYAKGLGVKYADYSKYTIERANNMNMALSTLPDEAQPYCVTDLSNYKKITGNSLTKAQKEHGYACSVTPYDIDLKKAGIADVPTETASGESVIFTNTHGYKNIDDITVAKEKSTKKIISDGRGKGFNFNVSGESTAFHECGHTYANKYGIPGAFKADAERWYKETQCLQLKSNSEAWAEAYGAYYTNADNLPTYIRRYFDKGEWKEVSGSKVLSLDDWQSKVEKLNKSVAKTADSGIIEEREMLPRKSSKEAFSVDWSKIQSKDYSNKFKKLTDDEKVASTIETRAKWALNNRDGVKTEELYAVNMKTGEEVGRITDQHFESAVKRTPSFETKLAKADLSGDEILLIHNHPIGLPPSISDINALLGKNNVSGITAGHNGSVYKYTKPKIKIKDDDWNIAMKHFKSYSEQTAMEKSLNILSIKYAFEITKL